MQEFRNRVAAGRELAAELNRQLTPRPDTLVLALPRGGVPVALEIALALDAELDVLIVRKLGLPHHEELAMGAIASGGVRVLNEEVILAGNVSEATLDTVTGREQRELQRRQQAYRGARPYPRLRGRRLILVDDGIATGATMSAAVAAVRSRQPEELIVAIPVAPPDSVARLRKQADQVIALITPEPFYAIGPWYRDFSQTEDDEVRELLARAWHIPSIGQPGSRDAPRLRP